MKKVILLILVFILELDAGVAKADFTFGEPTNLGPKLNSSGKDMPCSLSLDGLSLYFINYISYQPGGLYRPDGDEILVTRRLSTDDDWGEPEHLGPAINTPDDLVSDCMPDISDDGLELYFMSNRPGSYAGNYDLWVATRETTDDDWGEPNNLGPPINTEYDEAFPRILHDGLTLIFSDWFVPRPGGQGHCDLWISTRPTTDDPWEEPENLGETVNSPYFDSEPYLTYDGLVLLFASNRPGGFSFIDLWMTTRKTIDSPWNQPKNLGQPINGNFVNGTPFVLVDGSTLYFRSKRPGGYGDLDIWQAPIEPVVDLNTDGIVDATDMCIVVDNWGTDNQLCDVGPMPWGDGIIDVQDLIVIAEHLFEEFPPAESAE